MLSIPHARVRFQPANKEAFSTVGYYGLSDNEKSTIGTVIGMIFGLMMFENLTMGSVIGAAVGLDIGAMMDAQEHNNKIMLVK